LTSFIHYFDHKNFILSKCFVRLVELKLRDLLQIHGSAPMVATATHATGHQHAAIVLKRKDGLCNHAGYVKQEPTKNWRLLQKVKTARIPLWNPHFRRFDKEYFYKPFRWRFNSLTYSLFSFFLLFHQQRLAPLPQIFKHDITTIPLNNYHDICD
jgi:hypothetical protein